MEWWSIGGKEEEWNDEIMEGQTTTAFFDFAQGRRKDEENTKHNKNVIMK